MDSSYSLLKGCNKQSPALTRYTPTLQPTHTPIVMSSSNQDTCQVCQNVAKELTISSCCTKIFCKKCIEPIIQNKTPCPKCGSKDTTARQTQQNKAETKGKPTTVSDNKKPTEQTTEPKRNKKEVRFQEQTKDILIGANSPDNPASPTKLQICQVCKKTPEKDQSVASRCCREIFCKACMKDITQHKKSCPCCGNAEPSRVYKQVSRYSIDLGASCVKECSWKGQISELDDHQKSCQFYSIECELCEESIQRRHMSSHLATDCPEKVVQCPKNCGGSFKQKNVSAHIEECGKLARQVADLIVKQDEHEKSIDGLNKQVQTPDKTVIDNQARVMAAIETSQQQQQQLNQELQTQINKCDKKHQEHLKKGEGLQQSIAKLEAGLKILKVTDQQPGAKEQEDINPRLEELLQELKTEQTKQHTMITEQQATIRELEGQIQEQKDTIERLSHTHWRGGTERPELFIEKVERVIRREVTSERITWCWAGILIALPSIAIATYENL